MNTYLILTDAAGDADIEAAFEWYESEQPGLGFEFLDEVRAAYERILQGRLSMPRFDRASDEQLREDSPMVFTSLWMVM